MTSGFNPIATTFVAKELRFGIEARHSMLRGVERITRAVAVTLGPKGRNVVIDPADPQDHPKVTKDGVTVARSIAFSCPFENIGAKLIRHASSRTNDVAGDGTTTTSVLTWSIFAEGYKSVATGTNPMDLKRGIDRAVETVIDNLRSQSKEVATEAELASVATISANGDMSIGALVAKAVHATGNEGVVRIVETTGRNTTCEVLDGLLLPSVGYLDGGSIVTDPAQQRVVFTGNTTTFVFIADEPLDSFEQVAPALVRAHESKQSLLVIAPKVSGLALEALRMNNSSRVLNCCAVEVSDADLRRDVLCYLGPTCVSTGIIVDQNSTLIQSPPNRSPLASDRATFLRASLDRLQPEDVTDVTRQRLANLVSKTAVVRVGGTSQVDCSERKDRVIDAVCATRAALREGVVPGGGSALLYATKCLRELRGENDDQDTGIQIVRNAIRLPCELIANNAGVQGSAVAQRILQKNALGHGYDAQRDKYVNMVEVGIVDPLLVVRTCLSDAASVAGLMLTTESVVCTDSLEAHGSDVGPDGNPKKRSQGITFPLHNVSAGLEGIISGS